MSCETETGFRARLCRSFAIDLRTLALFRMTLAVLLLIDLAQRWWNIEMLYTDHGIMPRDTLVSILGGSVKWTSLHYYTGANSWIQSITFLEAAICAVLLFFGCRTWAVTLLSWILFISLNRRLPNSSTGADIILRVLLFWSLFLPLGARWSFDAVVNTGKRIKQNRFASVATGAMLLQICYIYWFSVLWKMHPDWLSGKALGYALHLDLLVGPFAHVVRGNDSLTSLLTYATLAIEAVVPFIVLSPWLNALARWLGILAMWGLHIGIAMCMNIGIFPYVSMMCWMLFIPTESWEWLLGRKFFTSRKALIFGLGVRVRDFVRRFLWARPNKVQPTTIGSWLVVGLFLFVTLYNVMGVPQMTSRGVRIPRPMNLAAKMLRLDQTWKMFAPTPNTLDGWFTMPALLADGSMSDIWLKKEPPNSEKPQLISANFPDFRTNRAMCANRENPNSKFWTSFAFYVVKQWNAEHPPENKVVRMQVIYHAEAAHNQPTTPYTMLDLQVEK